MSASPQEKFSELIQALPLAGQSKDVPQFTLARIKRDAEILLKADAASGWLILGLCELYSRGRRSEAITALKNALRLGNGEQLVYGNVALGFSATGLDDEALKILVDHEKFMVGSAKYADQCVCSYAACGRTSKAFEWLGRLEKLNKEISDAHVGLRSVAGFAVEEGLDDDLLSRVSKAAVALVFQVTDYPIVQRHWTVVRDSDSKWLALHLYIDGSSAQVADVNLNLAITMAEMAEVQSMTTRLVVRAMPWRKYLGDYSWGSAEAC